MVLTVERELVRLVRLRVRVRVGGLRVCVAVCVWLGVCAALAAYR